MNYKIPYVFFILVYLAYCSTVLIYVINDMIVTVSDASSDSSPCSFDAKSGLEWHGDRNSYALRSNESCNSDT